MNTKNSLQCSRLLILVFIVFSISVSYSQDCNAVLFMKEGAVLTYGQYNKKGKKESTTIHQTTNIQSEGKNSLTATIKASVTDVKNKETFDTTYSASCKNGLFSLDMLRFFNHNKLAAYNNDAKFELKINGDVLEFPVGMKPGDQLNDGHITIKVNSNGFTLITLTNNIINRKIISKEEITTPAGTFMCQKVSFEFDSKVGILNVKGTGTEWYYKDVVLVRSESYNKKGKLTGYSELMEYK